MNRKLVQDWSFQFCEFISNPRIIIRGKDRLIARYSRMRNLQKRVSGNIIGPKNLIKELFCVCIHNYSSLRQRLMKLIKLRQMRFQSICDLLHNKMKPSSDEPTEMFRSV